MLALCTRGGEGRAISKACKPSPVWISHGCLYHHQKPNRSGACWILGQLFAQWARRRRHNSILTIRLIFIRVWPWLKAKCQSPSHSAQSMNYIYFPKNRVKISHPKITKAEETFNKVCLFHPEKTWFIPLYFLIVKASESDLANYHLKHYKMITLFKKYN